jgi:hypothetical protein
MATVGDIKKMLPSLDENLRREAYRGFGLGDPTGKSSDELLVALVIHLTSLSDTDTSTWEPPVEDEAAKLSKVILTQMDRNQRAVREMLGQLPGQIAHALNTKLEAILAQATSANAKAEQALEKATAVQDLLQQMSEGIAEDLASLKQTAGQIELALTEVAKAAEVTQTHQEVLGEVGRMAGTLNDSLQQLTEEVQSLPQALEVRGLLAGLPPQGGGQGQQGPVTGPAGGQQGQSPWGRQDDDPRGAFGRS